MCNGHADICDIQDPNMPKKLVCRCQHNTCGPQCATCCKGFEQKKWRQSTASKKFICERKNNLVLTWKENLLLIELAIIKFSQL